MTNEFEKRIDSLSFDTQDKQEVKKLVIEAGKEFPCLICPSKDECENFKWFIKWFG
jgi:hypothetical protein